MDELLEGKLRRLRGIIASFPSALVAYSGGVDSTLLAYITHETLGDRMTAVLVVSPLMPPREAERAKGTAASLGIPLETVETNELLLPDFSHNPPDRCYICKKHRLGMLRGMAAERGRGAVLEGSNLDDAGMHRPGRRACAELGASSPLEEAGLAKSGIRALAQEAGLPNWDAPSRPCLATRFPYGMEMTAELIARIDAAEEALEGLGLREVRVRLEAPETARIEAGAGELEILNGKDTRGEAVKKLAGLGFRRILLDLDGYRSGSMDEGITDRRCSILYGANPNVG